MVAVDMPTCEVVVNEVSSLIDVVFALLLLLSAALTAVEILSPREIAAIDPDLTFRRGTSLWILCCELENIIVVNGQWAKRGRTMTF
jgi:hypothetical protein